MKRMYIVIGGGAVVIFPYVKKQKKIPLASHAARPCVGVNAGM